MNEHAMSFRTIERLAEPLVINGVTLPNRVFLAPMSGISDRPFRDLASRFGAGMVVSEMIAGDQLAQGRREAVLRAERTDGAPHVIQLAGREARWMAEGARAATAAGADIIDINMGCPAKKVTTGYAGSALMRDLDQALRLIDATVAATPLPVTVKMRLGWDDTNHNAAELARRAEAAGVKMVTVHGRTRCQFYRGTADWAAIRAVKQSVSIPVIANGDLTRADDVAKMLSLSGADGIMIGRGAYGRPWFPGQIANMAATGRVPDALPADQLVTVVLAHYEALLEHYGALLGVRNARKHLAWYMDVGAGDFAGKEPLRHAILTETNFRAVGRLLRVYFDRDDKRRAA
jgi:nifR3 family TIM-barrel protein